MTAVVDSDTVQSKSTRYEVFISTFEHRQVGFFCHPRTALLKVFAREEKNCGVWKPDVEADVVAFGDSSCLSMAELVSCSTSRASIRLSLKQPTMVEALRKVLT